MSIIPHIIEKKKCSQCFFPPTFRQKVETYQDLELGLCVQRGTYLIDEKLQLDDSRATLMLAVTLYTGTAKAVLGLVKVKSVKRKKIQ